MKLIYQKAKDSPLFKGINEDGFAAMLQCVGAHVKTYQKGERIWLAGDPADTVGLILSGGVQILREDAFGRQNLMAELGEGALYGEVFACAGLASSPVTVAATMPSQVLHINFCKLVSTCSSACTFHNRLIENMLAIMAKKTLHMHEKVEILSKRTTRERVLVYFEQLGKGARRLTIPFSREALAAYLCVDRSALSAELSRMQRDGLIRYRRNCVELLEGKGGD